MVDVSSPPKSSTLALAALLVLAAVTASPTIAQKPDKSVKDQLEFGVEMAQRGLWSEALFRFRAVEKIAPENSAVVNNLAVAHEALGLFDEALVYYRRAIELDPANRGLKRNYSRFVEFYQGFKRPEADEEDAEAGEAARDEPPATDSGELRR